MSVLANVVSIIHSIFILFIVLAPFTSVPAIWYIHIMITASMITHWIVNDSLCSLTILESYLRGMKHEETFFHSLISPFYDISENKLNTIIWVLTFSLFVISFYKLFSHIKQKLDKDGKINILCILDKNC